MGTVVVFGGTGFLGKYLVRLLKASGNDIFVFTRRCSTGARPESRITFFDSFDNEKLSNQHIDAVFHLASAQPGSAPSYAELYSANVDFSLKVAEFVRKRNIPQLIYTSTTTVYGLQPHGTVLSEGICPEPANHYGLTKYIAEMLLRVELAGTDSKVSVVRLPSVFGLNSGGGIVETLCTTALSGKDIEVFSKGERFRNLIHARSASELLMLLYSNRSSLGRFEVFAGGSRDSLMLYQIAETVVRLTESKSRIIPVDKFPPHDADIIVNTEKACTRLGFRPLTIAEGLSEYITEMKSENI